MDGGAESREAVDVGSNFERAEEVEVEVCWVAERGSLALFRKEA